MLRRRNGKRIAKVAPLRRQKSMKRCNSTDTTNSANEKRKKSTRTIFPEVNVSLHRKKKYPTPVLNYKGSIVLWKAKKNVDILIYLHEVAGVYEIVTLDRSSSDRVHEMNRLYVMKNFIEVIVEKSHYMRRIKARHGELFNR